MSTLKMTFSLASLIFLIALGLVFVPTSVMAHTVVDDADADPVTHISGHAPTDTAPHPVVKSVTFLGGAADGYVNEDSFEVQVVFEAANTAKRYTTPTTAVGTGDITVAGFTVIDARGTLTTRTYRVNHDTHPAGDAVAIVLATTVTDSATTPGVAYLGTLETMPKSVIFDDAEPEVMNGRAQPMAGKSFPLNNELTEAFDVIFEITDASGDTDSPPVAGALDGTTFDVTAKPDTLTFSNKRSIGNNQYAATATPKTVKTAETAATSVTITASVMDKAGNTGTGTVMVTLKARTAGTTTTTPTGTGEVAFKETIPAKSYVIVAKTTMPKGLDDYSFPAPATGSSATTIKAWSDIPNLEDLFFRGGSLSLTTLKATKLDRDKKADTATEEAQVRDVIITEIMAARNNALVGKDDWLTHQWIELYNNLPVPVAVELVAKSGRPAPSAADTHIQLDLVSNVMNPGWNFTGLGADGFDNSAELKADESDRAPTLQPFTSFCRKERGKDGHTKGHWMTSTDTFVANHIGTPGASERSGNVAVTATNPTYNVVINEIGNYANDAYDWIELRNVNQGDGNLKKWQLWEITGDKKKSTILNMPDNDSHKIGAVGDVLLIVATDPYRDPDHPLAAGHKINKDQANPETSGIKAPNSRYYVAGTGFKLANDGKSLLLLRSRNDGGDHEGIVDLTGTLFITDQSNDFATDVWPLKGQTKGNDNHGHGDVVKGTDDEDFRSGHVYQRINASRGTGKEVWERRGYTGIGYKRSASAIGQHGGTPGFDNGLIKEKDSDLAGTSSVSISEIMYQRGNRDNLPQWIELYNSSHTQAINLNEWKLKIENDRDDVDVRAPAVTIGNLGGTIIHPNQTVLIVAYSGRNSREGLGGTTDFPASRVINLSGKAELEIATDANKRNYRLLSGTAFKLTLIEKGGGTVDVAGNLGADPAWELPMNNVDEGRASIIRRYNEGSSVQGGMGMAKGGTMGVFSGKKNAGGMAGNAGWVYAAASDLAGARQNETYYGNADDLGTPGYRDGGPLPVSLSKFRPERLESGEIVVRWITESELNNAGFNILRSDTRDGQFTKINTSLIAGNGTTSERNTYEWKDASAKPNVVYYYQIQDVSLDGKVTTLRQSRLKGDISAAGKLTTTWGELKALQ